MTNRQRVLANMRATPLRDRGGQALPVAMGALALGAILITPLLPGPARVAGDEPRRHAGEGALQHGRRHRMVRVAPTIESPAYDRHFLHGAAAPAVSGDRERRVVPGRRRFATSPAAGAVEAQSPAWQGGGGVTSATRSRHRKRARSRCG